VDTKSIIAPYTTGSPECRGTSNIRGLILTLEGVQEDEDGRGTKTDAHVAKDASSEHTGYKRNCVALDRT
jgi:hypothetical protein